jgi:PAS domain S-box-containing protein
MLIGRSDYDLYPKEQADIFWKYDELVFKKGSSENEEVITWSDGTAHTIVTNKQRYIEKPTGKKFIVGTIHDVSGYKKIEAELRASEHKYHELFDNANDYIITIDLDGKITNANRTLLNYLQTDLDQITQHSVFDYIHRDHLESAKASKNKILAGIYNDPFEVVAIGANKQEVTFEVKASPMMQNGQLTGIQCVFSDVTLRKQATEKLEKYTQDLIDLNKTKDKFFSIIAHDLRNPYSSMIGFSEMLLEDLDDMSKEEIRDSLKIIHTSAKHSFNLLDNLLVWSRLQTGHMPFNQAPIALINAVEEVNNLLFSLAYRKKIEINNLVRPDIILYADKNMLHSILNNLVMNAIKYTPAGGKINIAAEHKNDSPETDPLFVSISVADTGIGMESELLENIFTANKVISKPGTDREQGTGLGLLLTREMIEKHGGNISAGSIPGEGSVFTFQLPAYKPDHIKQEQHKTPGDEIHVDTSN